MGKRAICQGSITFIFGLLLFILAAPKVSANALPYSWEGGGGNELPAGENCSVEVQGKSCPLPWIPGKAATLSKGR